MPFIGNKPSAVPLTSADIADGIITSAKIVDGTILNADINASAAIVSTKLSGVGATAGQVIQVLGATDSTQRSTTSTSFVTASNTLSVTITPSATSSKFAIFATHYGYTNSAVVFYTIYRDSTNLGGSNGIGYFDTYNTAIDGVISYCHLDSPSTTSAITYQCYMRVSGGTGYMGSTNRVAQIIVMEIKG
jgi:hypothetical protein